MVEQKWAIEQLSKLASVTTKFGWQTSNLRNHLGLEKQKHSKGDAIVATHAVDGIALAASHQGWTSGDTKTQVSVSDINWKPIAQFSKFKVQLLQHSTGLICQPIIRGASSSRH